MNVIADPQYKPGGPDATAFTDAGIAATRAVIDVVDSTIVALVERRRALSHEIQQLRLSRGEPRLSVSWELEIVDSYRSALGKSGSDLARVILAVSRGALPDHA